MLARRPYSIAELRQDALGPVIFCAEGDFRGLLDEIALSESFHAVPVPLRTHAGEIITARLWGRPITIEPKNGSYFAKRRLLGGALVVELG